MVVACGSDQNQDTAAIPDQIDFNFHVRPILSDRCYACHGPDENTREADLRLDTREGAFAMRDSANQRYTIVPGDAHQSILVSVISSDDPEVIMPPPESNLKLNDREIMILKKWVEQGAEWKDHWSFIPPKRPDLPKAKSKHTKNEIDLFVSERLRAEGLKPSPEASKEKLIRRLSFDLRGIPPTLAEIDQFIENENEDAYEKVVDQFLAESSYGERMASEWMDIARYADSHGYQDDIERSMWPWRDWVIESFNQDMSYRDFVMQQIAGDLFENATYENKLATGFNRNHKITQEVGVIDEEYRVTYVLDRVKTFSTAFMGLTVECAQCHDHKYDPISQKEYYQLFSFFNNVPEKGRVEYNVEVAEPYLPLPDEKVNSIRSYVEGALSDQNAKLDQYLAALPEDAGQDYFENYPVENATMPRGSSAWYPFDYLDDGGFPELVRAKNGEAINDLVLMNGKYSGAVEFVGNNHGKILQGKNIDFSKPFTWSFWLENIDGGIRGPIVSAVDQKKERVFSLEVNSRKHFVVRVGRKKSIYFSTQETIPQNKWVHVALSYSGSKDNRGLKIYMDGVLLTKYDDLGSISGSAASDVVYVGGSYNPKSENDKKAKELKGLYAARLDELIFYPRALGLSEVEQLQKFDPLAQIIASPSRSNTDRRRLQSHYLLRADPKYQKLINHYRSYKIRQMRTEDIQLKPTMVMAEKDTTRETYMLDRGMYDAPTEQVFPGTPASVLALADELPDNRLGLAHWLFDEKNPLTARVAVNRYWQLIFGRGIVATPDDFGSQGDLPTHPELLDWLAVDFVESGWKIKPLIKKMVMSATYRQKVEVNQKMLELDPENQFLARGPQLRLPAEMVRDHALAISGLLSKRVGGPSVKPYQPEGLWLEVASGNQSLRKYIQDHGDDLYRRSMYTFWKRTSPPPSMMMFDATTREQCEVRRQNTSTPMQALVLLNDPQFTEASRLIAERMLNEGGDTPADRIRFAFRLATSRYPSQAESDLLIDLFENEKSDYEKDDQAARALTNIGESSRDLNFDVSELAAYTSIASTILNLTEATQKS